MAGGVRVPAGEVRVPAGGRAVVYGNKKSLRKSGGFFVAENAKAFATS